MPSFDEILKICNRYQSSNYYVYPGIPEKKLATARNSYHIPDAERVAALLTDVWNTGTDGLAVARNGLYWHSQRAASSISWEELAEVSIVKKGWGVTRDIVFSDRKAFNFISNNPTKNIIRRAQNPSATFCGGKCGMGKSYSQLSIEERTLIQTQLSIGMKPAEIADGLKRSASTLSRELRRNDWVRPKTQRSRGRPLASGSYRAARVKC